MSNVIMACPVCSEWRIVYQPGEDIQQVTADLGMHIAYCVDDFPRCIGARILRNAADQVQAHDDELAATLRDMASEYAGPYIEPSPAYAYQKDASA